MLSQKKQILSNASNFDLQLKLILPDAGFFFQMMVTEPLAPVKI
jgi:hypothetical protein